MAKGAIAAPGALHLSYVHSPMRYIWEAAEEYAPAVPGGILGRAAFAALSRYRLRRWDVASTERVHAMVANSVYTQARIRRVYGRDAQVIEPPVDAARFARVPDPTPSASGEGIYLCVSALVPYKRVELAVRAFSQPGRPGARRRLVVVGDGPERARLSRLAGPNVELRGRVDDDELLGLYAACRAVVHPALDDFGIVPVEALAAGRPVVAFAAGGSLDSVRDGETGVLSLSRRRRRWPQRSTGWNGWPSSPRGCAPRPSVSIAPLRAALRRLRRIVAGSVGGARLSGRRAL